MLIYTGEYIKFLVEFYENLLSEAFSVQRAINAACSIDLDSQLLLHGLTLKQVHAAGGGEGEGEYTERVFRVAFLTGDVPVLHFKIIGRYLSDSGTEWYQSVHRVYEKQVVVTQYVTRL